MNLATPEETRRETQWAPDLPVGGMAWAGWWSCDGTPAHCGLVLVGVMFERVREGPP